ncbi:MAG: hypothetical protein ACPGUD_00995 [Parashewanella sp.]
MGFFSSLFSKSEQPIRQLNHAQDLIVGDMIDLDDSFALPAQLKGQQFKVEAVNTYEYEHSKTTEWQLKGVNDQAIFLTLDQDDEVQLAFSIKITRAQVEQLFDMEQFSQIFEETDDASLTISADQPFKQFSQWLGKEYHQNIFAQFGYFHHKDLRSVKDITDQGEEVESYQLTDITEKYAIDIDVYAGGETEVNLVMYRPETDIREFWPVS